MRSLNTLWWSKVLFFRWVVIFFSLSFKLITTEIGCRWSSDIHLEINGEIFMISLNVRSGCVTLARNTSIIRRKDRGCGFPEYFVVTKSFIFRWLGIFSIFFSLKMTTTESVFPWNASSTGTQRQILSEFGSESAAKWVLTKSHQDSVFSGSSAQEG